MRGSITALPLLVLIPIAGFANNDGDGRDGFNTITEKDIREHLVQLASPELEGRDAPSEEVLECDAARSVLEQRGGQGGLRHRDPDAELRRRGEGIALDPVDVELLLIALAPELDLRYQRLYAYLADDATRRKPSMELALDLTCVSCSGQVRCSGTASTDVSERREDCESGGGEDR